MFENVDGRTTDDGVTGILIAHLGAFGSGELTNEIALISKALTLCILMDSSFWIDTINLG